MKYKTTFLLFAILSLASCDLIYFDRMPGKVLPTIPDKFVGKYDVYQHSLINGKDTLEYDNSFYTLSKTSLNFHERKRPPLKWNDTFTMSEYKGYYFISLMEPSHYWNCFILQETNNGFIGCEVSSDSLIYADNQNAINELKKYFPEVQVIMIKNSDGNDVEEFYSKMHEDQVIAFFKGQVKKSDYTEFIKR